MNTRTMLTLVLVVLVAGFVTHGCEKPAEKKTATTTADTLTTAPTAKGTPAETDETPGQETTDQDPEQRAAPGTSPTHSPISQSIAEGLIAKWEHANPEVDWEAEERMSRTFLPSFDNSSLIGKETQAKSHPYRRWTEQDIHLWKRETEKAVVAGSLVFHSADLLDSSNGVSCDMCHPNAANTHPETYPKYQTQMGRVVLLRDMINWCLVNPVRAPALAADDERMRAMEAYIISQRSGEAMAYGKH